MKKKDRERRKAKKARTQKGYERTQKGNVCTHYDAYYCSRCGSCYACDHEVIDAPEQNFGSIFWWKCPDGFSKPSYPDLGQFANLRNVLPYDSKGIEWPNYAR